MFIHFLSKLSKLLHYSQEWRQKILFSVLVRQSKMFFQNIQFLIAFSIEQIDKLQVMEPIASKFRIFIIGTTAVGKTKLSVELAKLLQGEIISCDSKQLYKHASIMTAKVTEEEAKGVNHYMVDCLELYQNMFNRNKYFTQAYKHLQQIEHKNNTPIIVGGTNYYIETLLYNLKSNEKIISDGELNVKNEESGECEQKNLIQNPTSESTAQKLKELQTMKLQEKYKLLHQYDSLIANTLHPNNEQKITLFLQRCIQQNKKISANYQPFCSELRFDNSIVFWIRNSDKEELHLMISGRIEKMLDQKGVVEILSIYYYLERHQQWRKSQKGAELMKEVPAGAATSIGIRQFKTFYQEIRPEIIAIFQDKKEENGEDKKQKNGEEPNYEQISATIAKAYQDIEPKLSKETLKKCQEQLVLDTKHYCKRQITWIKNRIFVQPEQNKHKFFVLDLKQCQKEPKLSVLERFQTQVFEKAKKIIASIEQQGYGSISEKETQFVKVEKNGDLETWKKYACKYCEVEINGEYDWNCHINSKRHIKRQKYEEKRAQIEGLKQKYKSRKKDPLVD